MRPYKHIQDEDIPVNEFMEDRTFECAWSILTIVDYATGIVTLGSRMRTLSAPLYRQPGTMYDAIPREMKSIVCFYTDTNSMFLTRVIDLGISRTESLEVN